MVVDAGRDVFRDKKWRMHFSSTMSSLRVSQWALPASISKSASDCVTTRGAIQRVDAKESCRASLKFCGPTEVNQILMLFA